ncbi:type I pullulanase [Paenibacillus lemnae]|uniref:Type I pullulanase n=1 Tax=Paenibacillus lemnae TaxID=1330551 RepID=A0A848M9Q4_PAELE|nr:type I pullulanase [Paenibacillus lemnae]NMO97787.1 type I pullulanase [Paenibacillus lemnae]
MAVQKENHAYVDYGDINVTGGVSVFSSEFDEQFYYDGDDLGAAYTSEQTNFRLWAPTASEAFVLLYSEWNSEDSTKVPMLRDIQGTWTAKVEEDLMGKFYTYLVRIGSQWNEAADPYAKAVGVNGDRAAILDLSKTNPDGWSSSKPLLDHHLDSVIYELHIRDFSIHKDSGIQHKGKFLGLTEEGTHGPGGIPTGLDHIKKLGVTHVELLPVFDYATESVDETHLNEPQYNWGYDPKNYNVPEGSYATDPYSPEVRIQELKMMIQKLHDAGLRVIMDVVYNHVYDGYLINLSKLVPGYYLRYTEDRKLSNGSGCGNDVATERPMVRKFIKDSIVHWVHEYHMDGFRFDLMGLMDIETMNEIRRTLDDIDPTIMTIGEGWIMDTELPAEKRANQQHTDRLPGIGQFNDGFRDAVKGDIFIHDRKGFVSKGSSFEDHVKRGIVGGISYDAALTSYALEPVQTVNYAECHDNHTLWDKIELSAPEESEEVRRSMHRLASSLILTSQGIPFLHAGQEFYRTKGGIENSYKSPDEVNQMDWEQANRHQDGVEYVRRLIQLRKNYSGFRLRDADQIKRRLTFVDAPPNAVAYTIQGVEENGMREDLYVLHYAARDQIHLDLPHSGKWNVLFGEEMLSELYESHILVQGIGTVILSHSSKIPLTV